jgi:hypothetical protein
MISMNAGNSDMAARLAALAEKVGKMPPTGTIKAETALALMGEALSILGVALDESVKHTAIGADLAGRCNLLYDQLIELRTDRIWNKPAATA